MQARSLVEYDAAGLPLTSLENPWQGSGPGTSGGAAGSAAGGGPLDPDQDYSGQSCAYFTRPAAQEGRLNYYADGSFVIYGAYAYECVNRRWLGKGPAKAWLPAAASMRAEMLERN